MIAPSGTQWLGLGQGESMSGSNMFVMYSSGNNNITLSPRLGTGQFQPGVNPEARITLLEGTGISSDGVMTANLRCDSCLTWQGGSMSPTNGNSNWIWAIREGSALDSADVSADFREHDTYGSFTFDLPAGTSSDSGNPFLQVATTTQSAGSSQPSTSEGEEDSESEAGSSAGSSSGPSGRGSSTSGIREAHGIIMAVVFLFLFPIGALMIYLPFSRKVLLVHVPLQVLSTALLIAGTVLGIVLGVRIDEYDGYHQIIGYVVFGSLLLVQPALGLIQHLKYRKYGKSTIFGHVHRWHGRILIVLGIINGGLGLHVSGRIGSENVPRWAVIAYGVVAGLVGLFYIAFVAGSGIFRKQKPKLQDSTKYGNANGMANGHTGKSRK